MPAWSFSSKLRQLRRVLVREVGAQPAVVGRRHLAQLREQRLTGLRQRHLLTAAVAGVAPAADEALLLERIQVVGEGGAGDPHRLGHPRLRSPLL